MRPDDLASVTLACAVTADGMTRIGYGSLGPRPLLVVDDTGVLPTRPRRTAARWNGLRRSSSM